MSPFSLYIACSLNLHWELVRKNDAACDAIHDPEAHNAAKQAEEELQLLAQSYHDVLVDTEDQKWLAHTVLSESADELNGQAFLFCLGCSSSFTLT